MTDSIIGFIFSFVSSPLVYMFAALLSFVNGFNVAKRGEAGLRAAQLYILFSIVYLAFAGILWRMAQLAA